LRDRRALSAILMAADGTVQKKKLLLLQNKGGGHGAVGYYLCQNPTVRESMEVVVLQDKCNYKKAPFSSYKDDLEANGVKIINVDTTAVGVDYKSVIGDFQPDVVVDNWSKSVANASIAISIAQAAKSEQLVFISSAGMYKGNNVTPLLESDPVKTNDPRSVELAIIESGLPYTFLRPQYIYGPKSNKRYLDYFLGRASRKIHIPLPLHGEQLVALTHEEDVAALIAATLANPKAINQVFNCGTDKYVSYKAICDMIHSALNSDKEKDVKYMYFDPTLYSNVAFPFRKETFITSPTKAKAVLGWIPKHKFDKDIVDEVAAYVASPAANEAWGTEQLRADLEILSSKGYLVDPKFDE